MSWLELSFTLSAEQQPDFEAALEDLGALSVSLLDAQDHPIFEPGPGETPLWPTMRLVALFPANTDRAGLLHALTELTPELDPTQIAFSEIADQDWTRVWMDQFKPMRFGTRLWIYPWNVEPPEDPNAVVVRLDPGLAFGTGTHPTTALCLEWLDEADLAGKHMIDYGCGSGVLAIAALKLGAASAIALDNDPQALDASLSNAQRNAVAPRLHVLLSTAYSPQPVEVLIANILTGPLLELAACFAASLQTQGRLAISGILQGQEQELLDHYAHWFDNLKVRTREGWVLIDGVRADRNRSQGGIGSC